MYCPVCTLEDRFVPFENRKGPDGRIYDLKLCGSCKAIVNGTDLEAAQQPGSENDDRQVSSGISFYNLSPEARDGVGAEIVKSRSVIDFLLERCPNLQRRRLLDFGAGRGIMAAAATESFHRVVACDLNTETLLAYYPHLQNNDQIEIASSVGEPVDAILAWHTLEHLPDVKRTLEPVLAQLTDGGAFFWQVPMLKNEYLNYVHYTFFNKSAARALCESFGLSVVGVWFDTTFDFLTCIATKGTAAA